METKTWEQLAELFKTLKFNAEHEGQNDQFKFKVRLWKHKGKALRANLKIEDIK